MVEWSLPVYDVNKRSEGKYRIQTSGGGAVGTFITLYTTSASEAQTVEALQTDDYVNVKGRITGTSMRNIDIEDAILVK